MSYDSFASPTSDPESPSQASTRPVLRQSNQQSPAVAPSGAEHNMANLPESFLRISRDVASRQQNQQKSPSTGPQSQGLYHVHNGIYSTKKPNIPPTQGQIKASFLPRVRGDNTSYPTQDPDCDFKEDHLVGAFCHCCRAIAVPWLNKLPRVLDGDYVLTTGPQGSILEGVGLQDPIQIVIVTIVAHLDLLGEAYRTVDGLEMMFGLYPRARSAGKRIASINGHLRETTAENDKRNIPDYLAITYDLLLNPHLTVNQYCANVLSFNKTWAEAEFEADRSMNNIANASDSNGNFELEDQQSFGYPPYAYPIPSTATGLEEPAMSFSRQFQSRHTISRRDLGLGYASTPANKSSSWLNGIEDQGNSPAKGRETKRDQDGDSNEDSDEDSEEDFDEDLDFIQKKTTPKKQYPKSIKWEFVAGTDLSNAKLGEDDPSKFFLIRQRVDDPDIKDCRQYPQWENFDWNDAHDVVLLNKSRGRIRAQTSKSIAYSRTPWTQGEKDNMFKQVKQALKKGTRQQIDWDQIAINMNLHFFGVEQEKGEPLAQTSRMINGRMEVHHKVPRKLATARTGFSRSGKSIECQATKDAELLAIMRGANVGKQSNDSNEGAQEQNSDQEDEDNEEEEESVTNSAKRPRPRGSKSSPVQAPRKPRRGPPGLGGAAFSG